jgi:hypothetical protein
LGQLNGTRPGCIVLCFGITERFKIALDAGRLGATHTRPDAQSLDVKIESIYFAAGLPSDPGQFFSALIKSRRRDRA